MKVVVNKSAAENHSNLQALEIWKQARRKADEGLATFTYYKEDEYLHLDWEDIIKVVENDSEDTIICVETHETSIDFKIVEV